MKPKPKIVRKDTVPIEILSVRHGVHPSTKESKIIVTIRLLVDGNIVDRMYGLSDTNAARMAIDVFKQLPKETIQAVAEQGKEPVYLEE